jgi:hypothetical protein
MNRLNSICLVALSLLLAVFAFRPFLEISNVHASANRRFEFKLIDPYHYGSDGIFDGQVSNELRTAGQDGWQAVTVIGNGRVLLQREVPVGQAMPNIYK